MFLTNLTLGKKITLLTTIGLVLGVVVFSSLGMRAVDQATERMLQDRLTTAQLLADYVDEALGRALIELQDTAQMIKSNGTTDDLEPRIKALEDTYSRLLIYTQGIYLINETGQIIWSQPDNGEVGSVNLAVYPSISRAVNSGEASISGLVTAPMTDAPAIFLTSPIREAQPGHKGALVVAIDLAKSNIGGFIQPIRLGSTGYVEIVDQNGIVVARTEPGPKLAPFEQSDHSGHFATLITAGEPARGVCHTCHETEQRVEKKDVLAFVPLSEAQWGVVVRQSEEEALAPTRELQQNLIFFGVGLVSVALLFVVVTTRDVGSRIRMLTSASQRIAEGDLISPVTTAGKDEVGILAQTLDDMRVKLKTSYGELEQKTKELSSLLSVSEILTSPADLPKLLEAVVAKAVEIIAHADGGALLLQNTDSDSLQVQCAVGLEEELLSKFTFDSRSDFPPDFQEETSEERQKVAVKEAVAAFLQSNGLRTSVQSDISAEVFHRNQYIGSLIMVSFRDRQAFSESDHSLLQAIADYIAIAIERAQLTNEAEEARALHEADRLRSQFISSVSHELRTPLTLIKGYSTSLLRKNVSWDKTTQREFLQIIDEKTDELRDLIDKLLQSAKLEAGALKLEKEPVLMPKLAQKVVEDIALRAKKQKLTLEFAPSFPVVEADIRCMEQVLRNLVENAIKYSPEGGEIAITGEIKENEILVSVSDNGIGIPPEHKDKVFERFYRVDSPLTRGSSGSGLGLSITKGHVEAHGGKIWLESTVGKGSKFYFSLPLDHRKE
jgi:signal transduction histidine kinase/HAMP domain-containing protein